MGGAKIGIWAKILASHDRFDSMTYGQRNPRGEKPGARNRTSWTNVLTCSSLYCRRPNTV